MRLQEAKECYISGKTMQEIAEERIKEAAERNNKVGLLAYQKRQEELAKKQEPTEARPDNEPDLPDDPRSLAEIKAAVSEKATEDETWKRIKREIEEGKQR